MVLDTEVTFPKVTLWCSGVHLQDRTSITAYLHLYIGRDRASAADSSVDFLPFEIERGQSPTIGVPPRPKWQIIHDHSLSGRFSTLVRSIIHAQGGQPSSTRLLSRSVTYREHFLPYLLQVEILRRDPSLRLIL